MTETTKVDSKESTKIPTPEGTKTWEEIKSLLPENRIKGPGLRQRIARATSLEEISQLLEEGKTYLSASDKTRRSWEVTATARRNSLLKQVEEAKQKAKKEENKK